MFINVIVDEPTEVTITNPEENFYKSDMIEDTTTKYIDIKGKAMVDVRPQTYDDRFSGRLDYNKKYDVIICLRTYGTGKEATKRLDIISNQEKRDNIFNDKELTKKILDKGILKDETYSLQDLFKIRDALMMLARYGLEDKDLLTETLKYLEQKAER